MKKIKNNKKEKRPIKYPKENLNKIITKKIRAIKKK